MKRILLLSLSLAGLVSNAQILEQENFNAFALGNLGEQFGFETMNGTDANYQIVNIDAAHGKSLQIVGGTKSESMYAYKPDGLFSWSSRDTKNNLLKVSFMLYTGAEAGTGTGTVRSVVFDGEYSSVAGILYDFQTKNIRGIARLKKKADNTDANLLFNLGAETYEKNTWVPVSYTYNYSTGEITWTYPGGTYFVDSTNPTYNTIPSTTPGEMDFVSISSGSNAIVHTLGFDDYKAEAVSGGNLGVATPATVASKLRIYPNPVQDVLKIQTDEKVVSVDIFDASGKLNLSAKTAEVNVNHLSSGIYMLKITTDKAVHVEKMIKK
ncbi:T9SS type A sorting domain-containing protein [Soonwooa sp.]|uniref:T9SS type A sorting domain-containing protein n=1 Tax=Soonwooa sp. TaxID=1938592 RepID=UPI0026289535|nr:T9SS type A sorting domain-containing protein [Soonwooa sp.]